MLEQDLFDIRKLEKGLQSHDPLERRAAEMQLGIPADDESVDQLIHMIRTTRDSKCQLSAIECIGRTRHLRARDYLSSLLRRTEVECESPNGQMMGYDYYPDFFFIKYIFTSASEDLAAKLSYDGPRYSMTDNPKRLSEAEHEAICAENIYHRAIRSAIATLETR